jgi:hypothetical protein
MDNRELTEAHRAYYEQEIEGMIRRLKIEDGCRVVLKPVLPHFRCSCRFSLIGRTSNLIGKEISLYPMRGISLDLKNHPLIRSKIYDCYVVWPWLWVMAAISFTSARARSHETSWKAALAFVEKNASVDLDIASDGEWQLASERAAVVLS